MLRMSTRPENFIPWKPSCFQLEARCEFEPAGAARRRGQHVEVPGIVKPVMAEVFAGRDVADAEREHEAVAAGVRGQRPSIAGARARRSGWQSAVHKRSRRRPQRDVVDGAHLDPEAWRGIRAPERDVDVNTDLLAV